MLVFEGRGSLWWHLGFAVSNHRTIHLGLQGQQIAVLMTFLVVRLHDVLLNLLLQLVLLVPLQRLKPILFRLVVRVQGELFPHCLWCLIKWTSLVVLIWLVICGQQALLEITSMAVGIAEWLLEPALVFVWL